MDTQPAARRLPAEIVHLGLPALVVLLGLQALRVFIPSLAWYLRDTVGVSSATLGAFALGTFALGFLAAPLRRLLGHARFLRLAVAGLALARLAEQLVHHPAADLGLSLLASLLFLLALPATLAHSRLVQPESSAGAIAGGWAVGLALDTALKGWAGTLDLSWWHGPLALIVVLIECGAAVLLLWRSPSAPPDGLAEATPRAAQALVGLGPLLFLQAMIYQNLGWLSQVASLTPAAALVLAMIGNLVLAAGVWVGLRRPFALRPLTALVGTACLTLSVTVAGQTTSVFAFNVVIAQFVVGWSLAAIALAAGEPAGRGIAHSSAWVNAGLLAFLLLALAYYISLEVALPLQRTDLLTLTAVAFGLPVLRATTLLSPRPRPSALAAAPFAGVALVFLPTLAFALLQPGAPHTPRPGQTPLRILTYNIHSAFNSQGAQDVEAIAGVIEATGADVVGLQEVSRGWLLDGSTDLAALLARRLNMQILFQGTADPVWGNALLTRLPILESGSAPLPLAGTRLPRGYLWAKLDAGLPEPLLVIVTHLHHVESEHAPRLAQVPVLLDFWDGRPYTILLGDLNSEPGYVEMQLIADAGLVDAWAQAGMGDGLTWPAVDPFERIDWIWHTPDLYTTRAEVLTTTASDHLPLRVELMPTP